MSKVFFKAAVLTGLPAACNSVARCSTKTFLRSALVSGAVIVGAATGATGAEGATAAGAAGASGTSIKGPKPGPVQLGSRIITIKLTLRIHVE